MKTIILSTALVACLASAAFARFEGVMDMKITARQGNGTVRMSLGKGGVRTEMKMGAQGMGMTMTMLVKADDPDTAYQINDEAKTYSVVDLKAARDRASKAGGEKYSVEKVGTEKLMGYVCERVRITGGKGERTELWTTKEIADYDSFSRTLGGQSGLKPGFDKSLRDAGADGFPVRSEHRGPNGETVTMELVSVSQKAPPASLFQLPAGYRKASGPQGPGGAALPPDAMKAMQEQMKDMSPEQREMMEKMMKRR